MFSEFTTNKIAWKF